MSIRLLKIWLDLIINLIISKVIKRLVLFIKYGISMIFKYNFNWESLRI